MFITFDYKCPHCGHVETRFVRRSEMDNQRHVDCVGSPAPLMTRLPAGTRTTFRFADSKLKD